jgi:hypothetical protein
MIFSTIYCRHCGISRYYRIRVTNDSQKKVIKQYICESCGHIITQEEYKLPIPKKY